TLLLLNGGLRIAETAFAYIRLCEPYYRVIVPTYPPIWDIDALTDGIIAILDMEGVQDFMVLGQSYGGMVAQVMIQRFPGRVSKCVLSSTGPLSAPLVQRVMLRFFLAVIPILPEKIVKNIYKKSLWQVLSIPETDLPFWKPFLDEIFDNRLTKDDVLSHFRTGADTLRKYGVGMQEPWRGEVLVIGGDKDPVSTDGDRRAMLNYYPQAKLIVIQGAGHTMAMHKPGEFIKHIRQFFDEL
ncbi:MAG: alpha/beta hydrolase, partial [Anaerolineales bacterium]|nr:alpha/beta hydrolase [Anaerolineales bacterium]